MNKKRWKDGYGTLMKKGSYSKNDIPKFNFKCKHSLDSEIIEVYYCSGGGYYHKMRECKKCKSWISVGMEKHPYGTHRFNIPQKNGFMKCQDCELRICPHPVIWYK